MKWQRPIYVSREELPCAIAEGERLVRYFEQAPFFERTRWLGWTRRKLAELKRLAVEGEEGA